MADPLELARAELAAAIVRAAPRGRPRRRRPGAIVRTLFRAWFAQTWLLRSLALFLVLVAGRQSGKSHVAAFACLQAALSRPRSFIAVLAPTYVHAEAAIAKLRELAAVIPGVDETSWNEQKKRLRLPGGRVIRVFSADRKETVRGPSILLLWLEEAALLSVEARDAALGALGATSGARVLVTTSPIGKNWVYPWWTRDRDKAPELADSTESFRFRSSDSPYYQRAIVEAARSAMTAEKAAQEYDAEFVDSLLIVFPDRSRLYVDEKDLPPRPNPMGLWCGIDVARDQDWLVLTLMNGWGEARIHERTQRFGSWAKKHEEIAATLLELGATAVVDTGGPGGAAGAVLADYLEGRGVKVLRVGTHNTATKAQIVEQTKLDVEVARIVVVRGPHTPQLEHELGKFQCVKRVVKGVEWNIYEGPQIRGEHDDCVVSLCLANWGRTHGDPPDENPLTGDFTGFGALGALPGSEGRISSRASEALGGFGGIPR